MRELHKKFPFQKLLCAYAFPHCVLDSEGLALKLPLCYEGKEHIAVYE